MKYLLFLFPVFVLSCSRDNSSELLRAGIEKYKNKDYKGSIETLTEAIRQKITFDSAYFHRATAYRFFGDNKSALEDLNRAIEINPKYAEAYSNRGLLKSSDENPESEIADFTKAIELKPDYKSAWFNRGNVYLDRGKYFDAINDYNRAIAIDKDYMQAYFNRGNAKDGLNDYEGAFADYARCAGMSFLNGGETYYLMGLDKIQMDDKEGGCYFLKKAQEAGYPSAGGKIKQYCK